MKETIKNLCKAFIGESEARNRYTFYSRAAFKEGYIQLSDIFMLTAENEREHAKKLLEMINELKAKAKMKPAEAVLVDAEANTSFGDTKANLQAAIAGEHYETTSMYPDFAKVAQKEGLTDIAGRLRSLAVAEAHHEERYAKYLGLIESGALWKRSEVKAWVCHECGYVHVGKEPPKVCPSCKHPSNFFMIKSEEF